MHDAIVMAHQPEGFAVEFWPGYGFTASNRVTTNGSLALLLSCFKQESSRDLVIEFAREVADTGDELATRQLARVAALLSKESP